MYVDILIIADLRFEHVDIAVRCWRVRTQSAMSSSLTSACSRAWSWSPAIVPRFNKTLLRGSFRWDGRDMMSVVGGHPDNIHDRRYFVDKRHLNPKFCLMQVWRDLAWNKRPFTTGIFCLVSTANCESQLKRKSLRSFVFHWLTNHIIAGEEWPTKPFLFTSGTQRMIKLRCTFTILFFPVLSLWMPWIFTMIFIYSTGKVNKAY